MERRERRLRERRKGGKKWEEEGGRKACSREGICILVLYIAWLSSIPQASPGVALENQD